MKHVRLPHDSPKRDASGENRQGRQYQFRMLRLVIHFCTEIALCRGHLTGTRSGFRRVHQISMIIAAGPNDRERVERRVDVLRQTQNHLRHRDQEQPPGIVPTSA